MGRGGEREREQKNGGKREGQSNILASGLDAYFCSAVCCCLEIRILFIEPNAEPVLMLNVCFETLTSTLNV